MTGFGSGVYATVKYNSTTGDTIWTRKYPNGVNTLNEATNIAVDKDGNIYVTGQLDISANPATGSRGTPASIDYLTLKYSSEGMFQWSQEYNGPGNFTDEAVDIAVDNQGNVYVTGGSFGDTTNFDYATIKYGQSGNGSPDDCWVRDTFDDLPPGCIDGHNDWQTVPGRSCANVIANPFGPGNVMLMDTGPNETINNGKDVNVQLSGIHNISLDVLVDGNPDPNEPTLAKVEIRTTGNPNWDKKFQLYFGAHMRLNYGPTRQDAQEFLSANDLVKQHWYHVEAVVDLSTNLVDIFLDGVFKLDNIPVGPGPITDISVSAWDRPGQVFYDNLHFCSTSTPAPGQCPITSFFDNDDEGWTVMEDVQDPIHFQTGGNHGGYISATDIGTGQRWLWQASAKFLGDLSCAYDKALNFDLRHIANNHSGTDEDVILEGAGLTLVYDTNNNPDVNWTAYSVPLNENAGWKKDNLNGDLPTQGEMQTVLSSLTSLFIRGEYSPFAGDIGHLDNVVLGGPIKGVGPLRSVSQNILSEEGDGDGRPEAGELIGISVELVNGGIETANNVNAILSTSDPDISIDNDSSDWPNIASGDSAESIVSLDFTINPELAEEKLITFTLKISASNGGPWMSTFDLNITPENLPPILVIAIADTILAVGDTTVIRDLNAEPAVFDDPDQDLNALTYFTASSDSGKVTATIEGSLLTAVALDTGVAIIIVTANDGRGGTAQTSFAIDIDPVTSVDIEDESHVITEYRLYQNYPNPFNPGTLIQYDIPKPDDVLLKVYNIAGQEVRTLVNMLQKMGAHQISWDGKDDRGLQVSSGIYIYRIQSGSFVQNRKMTLLR